MLKPRGKLAAFVGGLAVGILIAVAGAAFAAYGVYREAWKYPRFRHHSRPIVSGMKKYWELTLDEWDARFGPYLPWRLRPRPRRAKRDAAPEPLPVDNVRQQIEALNIVSEWRYIVIHHSATASETLASVTRAHQARGWQSAGYHFLIRAGTKERPNDAGKIEVSERWAEQMYGAHAGNVEYNEFGIGICLAGNFDKTTPSSAQVKALKELVGALQWRFGIPSERVVLHRDIQRTACPGVYFPLPALQRSLFKGPLTAHPPAPPEPEPVEATDTAGVVTETTATTTTNR